MYKIDVTTKREQFDVVFFLIAPNELENFDGMHVPKLLKTALACRQTRPVTLKVTVLYMYDTKAYLCFLRYLWSGPSGASSITNITTGSWHIPSTEI